MTRRTRTGVMRTTIGVVPTRTQPAASLHGRSAIEGMVETTATYATSSVVVMHMAG
jgi:hypothetical protein